MSRPIFRSFGMLSEYSKLQKASYETYYKNIPNMVKFSNYGKTSMTDVVIKYEKEFPKQYENLYNLQLAFIRQTICNLMIATIKRKLNNEVIKRGCC